MAGKMFYEHLLNYGIHVLVEHPLQCVALTYADSVVQWSSPSSLSYINVALYWYWIA